jgi:GDPmannose 4,6-dehydratase
MLQQDVAKDYVIATGVQYSVRDFVDQAAQRIGVTLRWEGEGVDEHGVVAAIADGASEQRCPAISVGQTIVRVDPHYFRPAEVETLLGDASKAKAELGWTPEISFADMVDEMMEADLLSARKLAMVKGVTW